MSKEKTLNMSDRDKELARQAWTENDWDGYLNVPKLIQLVRADERSNIRPQSSMAYQEGMEAGRLAEREACAKVCEQQIEKENLLKTGDNQTLSNLLIGHRVTAHMTDARLIRARGDA